MRSLLFSPADRPDLLRKGPDTGADALISDLEDAVAPDATPEARDRLREVLTDPAFDPDCGVYVRVNHGERGLADVRALLGGAEPRLDGLVVPKVAATGDVTAVAEAAAEAGRPRPILALIESAAGVQLAPSVARLEGVTGLLFGAEDLAADVGATRTRDGTEVLYARQRVVIAAAAGGCRAIDTIVTDFTDERRLREDAATAVGLGYDGKLAIHPDQVAPINEAFTPDEEEIEWARTVLTAAEEAEGAVFEVDGEMIDAPLLAQAERVLERAADQ